MIFQKNQRTFGGRSQLEDDAVLQQKKAIARWPLFS